MQGVDWDNLRFVLALHRAGTHAAAGRALGVNETTVGRRLRALERELQSPLFHRAFNGRFEASDVGRAVIRHAQHIESQVLAISDVVGMHKEKLIGTIRITSVPIVVNKVLVPNLLDLRSAHPDLTVELIPDARNLSLTRREADLAIRLARPSSGGLNVMSRKLGTLTYMVYSPAAVSDAEAADLEWIAYDEGHLHLPQARWLNDVIRKEGAAHSCLRVADAETAVEAVAAGLGKTVLPTVVANRDDRLRVVDANGCPDLPERDVWLLSHREQKDLRSVQVAIHWIVSLAW